MIYLTKFTLLDPKQENDIIDQRNIYNTYYPIGLFSSKEFYNIEFEPVTIFYGGNGSGKSTLLNMIAQKLNAMQRNKNIKGTNFDNYVNFCHEFLRGYPEEIKFISSDDVFDSLLDVRAINSGVNRRKEELSREYINNKYASQNAYDSYEDLKLRIETRKESMSSYIRKRLTNNNIIQNSNGESALMFWEREIDENSIYILDEPENSLSAENQLKLKKFLEDSARFYNCQFIIATHSPFLLAIEQAKIYDLDAFPVDTKKWSDLENVKIYQSFFKERESEF